MIEVYDTFDRIRGFCSTPSRLSQQWTYSSDLQSWLDALVLKPRPHNKTTTTSSITTTRKSILISTYTSIDSDFKLDMTRDRWT